VTQGRLAVADAVTAAAAARARSGRPGESWTDYLAARLASDWRPDEWRPDRWLLIVDPADSGNRVTSCSRPGCTTRLGSGKAACPSCRSEANFAEVSVRDLPLKTMRTWTSCDVRADTAQCSLPANSFGLCRPHQASLRGYAKRNGRLNPADETVRSAWIAQVHPQPMLAQPCDVPDCSRPAPRVGRPHADPVLCDVCDRSAKFAVAHRQADDRRDWLRHYAERLPVWTIDFSQLRSPLREEALFAMQTHDLRGTALFDVESWRKLVGWLARQDLVTLAELDFAAAVELGRSWNSSNVRALIRHSIQVVTTAHRAYGGYDPEIEMLLHLSDLGLRQTKTRRTPVRLVEPIDLSVIPQVWLREALRRWILDAREPWGCIKEALAVVTTVSAALTSKLADNGHDPTRLNTAAMTIAVRALHERWAPNDQLTTARATTIYGRLARWWQLCDHARRTNLWPDVPAGFARDPKLHTARGFHRSPRDEAKRADVPPSAVVAYIRNNLDMIDWGSHPERHQTAMALLIDTGRRPIEVVSLRVDCLAANEDGYWLRWDNHKAGRLDQRLPIDRVTAEVVQNWQQHKERTGLHSKWLLPSTASQLDTHISENGLANTLRRLRKSLPPMDGMVSDVDGAAVAPDLGVIHLYSFRHAYCQRHADAGTAPDVLRRLMDHENFLTTMTYYQVGERRKREAANQVAPLTLDRVGNVRRVDGIRRGVGTVAVPFGGCTEPSNVSAGGHACPVRYQCHGCSFFTVDPSYLPELDRHIAALKVNAAEARQMGQAAWVIDGFERERTAYIELRDKMRHAMTQLPVDEQARIAAAGDILRRARAAEAAGKTLPLAHIDTTAPGVLR
jgi:integrase